MSSTNGRLFYDRTGRPLTNEYELTDILSEYKPIYDSAGREIPYGSDKEIMEIRDKLIRMYSPKKNPDEYLSHCKQYYDRSGRQLTDEETAIMMMNRESLYDRNGKECPWTAEMEEERKDWIAWKDSKELSHADRSYYDMDGRQLDQTTYERYMRDNLPLYDRTGSRIYYDAERDMNQMRRDFRKMNHLRHGDDSMVAAEISPVSKMMGKKDILDRIANHDLMDEIKVGNKYLDYVHAMRDECPETAHKLYEMAYEEYTHARVLRDILLESGYKMTDDGEEELHDFKKRLEAMFRKA